MLSVMKRFEHGVAILQGLWAEKTVKLAAEPAGARSGVAEIQSGQSANSAASQGVNASEKTEPFTLAMVGDSMVAACGVSNQKEGLVPHVAELLAQKLARPVRWRGYGKLGATMRRVRYRLLPQVSDSDTCDLLILTAGSNDVMARRSLDEWESDLRASIREAKARASVVMVMSPGRFYEGPTFPKALAKACAESVERQRSVSKRVCREEGVRYLDLTDPVRGAFVREPGFWGSDRFHSSAKGYALIARAVVDQIPTRELRS